MITLDLYATSRKKALEMEPRKLGVVGEVNEERIPFFVLDEAEYTMPKKISPNIAVRYLRNVKEEGVDYAMAVVMEDLLGAEAMEALAESKTVTEEDMQWIMGEVEERLLAASKQIMGKSQKGRRR